MGTGKKATVKYKIYDNGKLIAECNYKEAEALTGLRAKNVHVYAQKGTTYKGRFRFERTDVPMREYRIINFKRDWNEARLAVYKKAGKDAIICNKCGKIIIDTRNIVYQFGENTVMCCDCLLGEE